MSNKIYTNAHPLRSCSFPHLEREIGVSVLRWNAYHDLSVEKVDLTVNTMSFGRGIRTPDEITPLVIQATGQVVEHLNTVIAELTDHRDRLAEELVRLELEGLQSE